MSYYPDVVRHVVNTGARRSPRGIPTLDAGHVTVVLTDPTKGLAVGCGRGLSPRVAATEALQLIGAFHDPELMVWSSPQFERFRDGFNAFYGAYGSRIDNQLTHVVTKLLLDPSTRQAVITLWDPALDNRPGEKDYPCTVALGFDLSQGMLNMNVVMRSNDVWLGFPYDVFQFTQLQLTLAHVLGRVAGTYTHTAWSMHIYVDNLKVTNQLTDHRIGVPSYQPQGLGLRLDALDRVIVATRELVYADYPYIPGREMTDSEEWYHRQFAGYRAARAADPTHLGPDVAGGR